MSDENNKRERDEGDVAAADAKKTKHNPQFLLTLSVIDENREQVLFGHSELCDDEKRCYMHVSDIMKKYFGKGSESTETELVEKLWNSNGDAERVKELINEYWGDSGQAFFNLVEL